MTRTVWFDSHCHLHICEESEPAEAIVERARAAGVTRLLTVGIDVASSERSVALAEEFEGVWAAVGMHPNDSIAWDAAAAGAIEALCNRSEVVAVGESGLDFYRDRAPEEVQRRAFADHVAMAKTYDRALVIHTRDSVRAALGVLEEAGPPDRLVFHCWSGSYHENLKRALDLGAYISFAGNVGFKSADDLRTAAAAVPTDRLLVETDSPFLAPVPYRGKPNEPAYVVHVGAAVAEARSVPAEEIGSLTHANAARLFGLE